MEELLKNKGWKYIGGCSCGGIPKRKFYNPLYPSYKVAVLYTRGSFIIMKNNTRYVEGKAEELELTLKNHGLYE